MLRLTTIPMQNYHFIFRKNSTEKKPFNKKGILKALVSLFCISFGIRIILEYFSIKNSAYLLPDSLDYIRLAKDLSLHFTYGANSAEIFRVPIYPLFLSIFQKCSLPYFFESVLTIQSFIDSLSACLIFLISYKLLDKKNISFPFIAAILYAVSPLAISSSLLILSETLFVFLLMLLIFSITYKTELKNFLPAFVNGILMGVLCLTRAVFIPISVIYILFFFFKFKKIKFAVLTTIIFVAIIFSWSYRNYYKTGYFGISTVSSINLYRYNACAVDANLKSKSFADMQKSYDQKLESIKGAKEQAVFAKEEGTKVISSNLSRYMYMHLRATGNTLLPAAGDLFRIFGCNIGSDGTLSVINTKGLISGIKYYFKDNYLLLILSIPFTLLLILEYILGIVGFISSMNKKNKSLITLLAITAIYFLLVSGVGGTPRFRLPAEPIIFIFAAIGLKHIISQIGCLKRKKH